MSTMRKKLLEPDDEQVETGCCGFFRSKPKSQPPELSHDEKMAHWSGKKIVATSKARAHLNPIYRDSIWSKREREAAAKAKAVLDAKRANYFEVHDKIAAKQEERKARWGKRT